MKLRTLIQPKKMLMISLTKCARFLPSKFYIKTLFRLRLGYKLSLENPKTFNEKIQWLKFYNQRAEYTRMVDKVAVKEYVAEIIGDKYVIPTLGVWDNPEDVDFDKLPNQFVLKTSHGGGSLGVVICKDKSRIDYKKVVKKLRAAKKQNIWHELKEWPYKNVNPRILAEEFLTSSSSQSDLTDYKFYCFNGVVTYCEVITGRYTKKQIDFFDLNWNHQKFTFDGYDFADELPIKPSLFDEMVGVATKLCKDLPYSRIDLYVVNNHVYFGEITFFPASGLRGFHPIEWNEQLGDLIQLPNKTISNN